MKNKEIRKSDLPEWEYGDVVIKKFSFGDKLKLSAFTSETIIETVKDTTTGKEVERVKRSAKTIDAYEITMFTIACGLHSIKDSDNYEYVLKGHSNIDEKLEFVKKLDLSFEAGKVILDEIKNFNVDISDEKKKID